MSAYAYLRRSGGTDPKHQKTREESAAVQEAEVRRLAEYNREAEDLVVLADWGISGRKGADARPGYAQLLEAIESGRATSVYAYSLSRLGRSVQELTRIVGDLDRRGIPLRLVKDKIDTSSSSGKLLFNVLTSVMEFESDVASERTKAAFDRRRAEGRKVSNTPFFADGDAVLEAFDREGTYSGAARALNAAGVKPRNGRSWWPSAVAVIVRRLRPDLKPTAGNRRPTGEVQVLTRVLRCPTCGTTLTGFRDRDGRRVRYACRLGSVTPHARVSVTEAHILEAFKREVSYLRTPAEVAGEDDGKQRADLEQRRRNVIDLAERGRISMAEADERLDAIDDEVRALDGRAVILQVPSIDWSWSPEALNIAMRAIFRSVTLDPATFQPVGFEWRVPEWRAA